MFCRPDFWRKRQPTAAPVRVFLPLNLDITDLLPQGLTTTVTMPADVITSHAFTAGLPEQYGVIFTFAMACAGRVKTLAIDPEAGNGQTVPIRLLL